MELATCIASLSTQFLSPFFEAPGIDAQKIMSPNGRDELIQDMDIVYRPSAVMILIYPNKKNQATTVFIERNTYNGAHSGQISLPGGGYETEDLNLVQTAIRETKEEIGYTVDSSFVLGQLTPLKIPVSSFEVTPVVAYTNEIPTFKREEAEVNSIIEFPIEKLLQLKIEHGCFETSVGRYKVKAPYFQLDKQKLWGATAMIISEFRTLWA